jgi:hypothetical protein
MKMLRFIVHIMTWELFFILIATVGWSYCTVKIMRYMRKERKKEEEHKAVLAACKRYSDEHPPIMVSEMPQFKKMAAEQALADQKEIDEQLEISIAEWEEEEMLEIVLMTDEELAKCTDYLCIRERQRRAELVLKEQEEEQKHKFVDGVGEGQAKSVKAQPNTDTTPPLSSKAFRERHEDNVSKAMDAFK